MKPLTAVWVAFSVAPQVLVSAQTVRNIPYAETPDQEQHLDFYWPAKPPEATVLFIHGGGLSEEGERRASPVYAGVCRRFVDAGVACATTDYRLPPSVTWPVIVEDVVRAIAKVRQLIESRGGDPDRLFLFGHSSGCQLAAVSACALR